MIKTCGTIFFLYLLLVNCTNKQKLPSQPQENHNPKITTSIQSYKAETIPGFFNEVLHQHRSDFKVIYKEDFNNISSQFKIATGDTNNQTTFYTFKFIHALFTSQEAADCSKGEILNIPYLWHWVIPNPRNEVYMISKKEKLSKIEPPNEFYAYKNYADIDRTPFLFLGDLFSERPSYYSVSCDTFSTFGWCSEREMAFVCLLEILGFKGKVVASGNHSWSEFKIPMIVSEGKTQMFKIKVDNTFNIIEWNSFQDNPAGSWENTLGDAELSKWYNDKAHSDKEKQKIKNFKPYQQSIEHIEKNLVEYINLKLNVL